uniref:Uncharacterized protein n=1 Tax=Anguilla anguilla TaxID=7936 RepID=A0A0E9S7U0_ANGAN
MWLSSKSRSKVHSFLTLFLCDRNYFFQFLLLKKKLWK